MWLDNNMGFIRFISLSILFLFSFWVCIESIFCLTGPCSPVFPAPEKDWLRGGTSHSVRKTTMKPVQFQTTLRTEKEMWKSNGERKAQNETNAAISRVRKWKLVFIFELSLGNKRDLAMTFHQWTGTRWEPHFTLWPDDLAFQTDWFASNNVLMYRFSFTH